VLRDAWFIGSRDVRYMLGRRETMLWTFVMPFVFFYFIGTVTSGFGGGRRDALALRVGPDAGFLADEVERRLAEQDFEVVRPDADPGAETPFERFDRRLEIPGQLTATVLAGTHQAVRFSSTSEGLAADYDAFRVRRAVYTVLADLLAATAPSADGTRPLASVDPAAFERLRATPRALQVAVSSAGKRQRAPRGFEQTIPGTMVMFTMIVLLTSGAATLVVERRQGLLRRLASAPISRGAVVLGKWSGKLALAIVQMGFAMIAGRLFFGVGWGPHLWAVVLVLLAYAGFTAWLGLLLGSLARTEGQAVAFGVLAANVSAGLGGCWWPIEITPPFMQRLAMFFPTGWTMDALHKLVSFGADPSAALPHVFGMALGTLVLAKVSARVFRFD
jgi:ABC-2 type transport system permease protein